MPATMVKANGITMRCLVEGSGEPLVLIHGVGNRLEAWDGVVARLGDRFRTVRYDLRGHGESAVTPGPATMETMANDVASLLETLNISRATIAGLSMGGYVALAFYRLFPLRVRSLLLADTRAQADTEEGKQVREQQAEKALKEGMEGIADASLPKLLAPETVTERPDIVRRVRDMIVGTEPEGAASALRGGSRRSRRRTVAGARGNPPHARRAGVVAQGMDSFVINALPAGDVDDHHSDEMARKMSTVAVRQMSSETVSEDSTR